MASADGPFAIVTGASSGIGYHLARECAQHGFDLLVAADRPEIAQAAEEFRGLGVGVDAIEADLARLEGVERLVAAVKGRAVDALLANAGHGLGHAFLDQDFDDVLHVIDTNITGTVCLVHRIGQQMRARQRPHPLHRLDRGLHARHVQCRLQRHQGVRRLVLVRAAHELKDSGVTVSVLMPGATDTEFFARADMLDTKVGAGKKDDPADVAKVGFKAMMDGEGDVVAGWKNKLQAAVANVTPASVLAQMHRKEAEPGSAG